MADTAKHKDWWEEPIGKVIIGVAIAVIGALLIPPIRALLLEAWNLIAKFCAAIWTFLIMTVPIPRWMFWSFMIYIAATIFWFAKYQNKLIQHRPSLEDYREDTFLGVTWRWKSLRNNMADDSLWCFCPECKMRLALASHCAGFELTFFVCENCDKRSETVPAGINDVLEYVRRMIERKINSGEWKKVVATRAPSSAS